MAGHEAVIVDPAQVWNAGRSFPREGLPFLDFRDEELKKDRPVRSQQLQHLFPPCGRQIHAFVSRELLKKAKSLAIRERRDFHGVEFVDGGR